MSSTAGAFDQRIGACGDAAVRRHVLAVVAQTALAVLVAFSAVLLLRRLGGAFQQPLGGVAIVLAAAILELAAFGVRFLFHDSTLRGSVLSTKCLAPSTKYVQLRLSSADVLCILSVLVAVVSLSIRGTPLVGLFIAWLIVIAGET